MNFSTAHTKLIMKSDSEHRQGFFLHILAKLRAQHLAMEPSYHSEPVLPPLFGSQRDIVLLSFVLHKKSKSNPVLYGRRPRPLSARRINLEAYQRCRPFSPRACPIN